MTIADRSIGVQSEEADCSAPKTCFIVRYQGGAWACTDSFTEKGEAVVRRNIQSPSLRSSQLWSLNGSFPLDVNIGWQEAWTYVRFVYICYMQYEKRLWFQSRTPRQSQNLSHRLFCHWHDHPMRIAHGHLRDLRRIEFRYNPQEKNKGCLRLMPTEPWSEIDQRDGRKGHTSTTNKLLVLNTFAFSSTTALPATPIVFDPTQWLELRLAY